MNYLLIARGLSNLISKSTHQSKTALSGKMVESVSSTIFLRLKNLYEIKSMAGANSRSLCLSAQNLQLPKVETSQKPMTNRDSNIPVTPHVDGTISYAYGRSSKELQYNTLAPLMESMSKREPHSTAVVVYDEGISKSLDQLNSDINKLVNGMFEKFKLRKGDRVGIYAYNNYQFLLVQFACNKLGLVLNPLNPSYKAHEFTYVLGNADVNVLFMPGKNSKQSSLNDHWSIICDPSLGALQSERKLSNLKNIVILDGDYDENELSMKNVKLSHWTSVFSGSHELGPQVQREINGVCSDDIYGIYYTSGTTGFPKGASVSQFTVINNSAHTYERMFKLRGPNFQSLRPNVCVPLPLFHQFAGVIGALIPFIGGGSFVLPGMRYSIRTVVESLIRFKCNTIFVTPTILIDLLGYIENNNIADKILLKTLLCAGSSVMSELVHRAHKLIPSLEEFRIGYGSSENGTIAALQSSLEPSDTQPYTVGAPIDFSEIRVTDVNTGQVTLLGQSGEVQTRGYNLMICYHNDPDRTEEVITQSRWYKTGDIGIIDTSGSLQIVGRIKDMIIRGGENIYPAEIETVLHKHDAIEDAHVFGVPDKRFGEEICVWIKLIETKRYRDENIMRKEIIDFCKSRLTYFKVPKYVMFVEEFPLTPVKKIKKHEMRTQATKMLNL